MSPAGYRGEVVGAGVDLCSVSRIGAALQRTPGLRERLFTAGEQAALDETRTGGGDVEADSGAAQMFAVKEAVMKSLGVGFDKVRFNSVEVYLEGPSVSLCGEASERAEHLGAGSFEVQVGFVHGPNGPVAIAEVVAIGS